MLKLTTSAVVASLAFINAAMADTAQLTWDTVQNYNYYAEHDFLPLIEEGGFEPVLSANAQLPEIDMWSHSGYPNPDAVLYTNPHTQRWMIVFQTHHVPHSYGGFISEEEQHYSVHSHGNFYQLDLDNQGRPRADNSMTNHGLCENITSPVRFHTSTNPVFMGLRNDGNLTRLFTGVGGRYLSEDVGFIAQQNPNGRCVLNREFQGLEFFTIS